MDYAKIGFISLDNTNNFVQKILINWNFFYNDLRCQSRNSMIGINWINLYLLFCNMFRPLLGHPQAKQITLTRNYIGQCLQFSNICNLRKY
jgi:hypothetical protein